jgi:protein-histidine pros-kinase
MSDDLSKNNLRQNPHNLESIILESATACAIVAIDLLGQVTYWNRGAENIFGYTRSEAVDLLNHSQLHLPKTANDGVHTSILDLAKKNSVWEGPVDALRKDGSFFHARIVLTPLIDNSKGLHGFVSVIRNVPGESDSEKRFRGLLEAAPDAIVIVNSEGKIVRLNTQAEQMFRYRHDQILGQSIDILVPDRFRSRHPQHRYRFFEGPRLRPMGDGLDLYGLRSDGTEFPVEISLSPLETEEGLWVTAAIRDVTERKRFQIVLQEKNDQLERAIMAKDRFLASMSHELRTPLNAVIGFTGTLLMRLPGPLTTDQESQLGIVRRSADHLLLLINDLLDLAKIESGKVETLPEDVDPGEVLREVAATLRPMAEIKDLVLELHCRSAPKELVTDRRMLQQVLINLVNNAIKFTDAGTVSLSVTSAFFNESDHVGFTVSDTGHGISKQDLDRLFEPFSQVRGPQVRQREGSGLGLHLCRKLAALMGGDIAVQSELGVGSSFTLWVPTRC